MLHEVCDATRLSVVLDEPSVPCRSQFAALVNYSALTRFM